MYACCIQHKWFDTHIFTVTGNATTATTSYTMLPTGPRTVETRPLQVLLKSFTSMSSFVSNLSVSFCNSFILVTLFTHKSRVFLQTQISEVFINIITSIPVCIILWYCYKYNIAIVSDRVALMWGAMVTEVLVSSDTSESWVSTMRGHWWQTVSWCHGLFLLIPTV